MIKEVTRVVVSRQNEAERQHIRKNLINFLEACCVIPPKFTGVLEITFNDGGISTSSRRETQVI